MFNLTLTINHRIDPESLEALRKMIGPGQVQAAIQSLLTRISKMDANTQAALDRLNQAVERDRTVTEGMVTLVNGLAEQIKQAADNAGANAQVLAAIDGAIAGFSANTDTLAAAITANTPADTGGNGGDTGGTGGDTGGNTGNGGDTGAGDTGSGDGSSGTGEASGDNPVKQGF